MHDPWSILGVVPGASARQIHAAWRKGVSRWHPDRNPSPDATARLEAINAAYASLRDGSAWRSPAAWSPRANSVLAGLSGTVLGEVVTPATTLAPDCMRVGLEIPAASWLLDEPVTLAIPAIGDVFTLLTLLRPGRLHDGSRLVFRRTGLTPIGRTTDLLVTLHFAVPTLPVPTPKPLAARA